MFINYNSVCPSSLFRDPEPFDWYQRYSGIRDLINQVLTILQSQ